MKYLQLMKKYPFPKNGRELNRELISTINKVNPDKKSILKLFYNNLGIVSKIYSENNYDKANATVEEFLSFYYESLLVAIKDFNNTRGMAFHSYLYTRMKSIISNDYKYTGAVVHIPVLQITKGKYETIQLTNAMSDGFLILSSNELDNKFDNILNDPFFDKKIKKLLSKDEYDFFQLSKEYLSTESAKKMKLTRGQQQRISERIKTKLKLLADTIELNKNINKKVDK